LNALLSLKDFIKLNNLIDDFLDVKDDNLPSTSDTDDLDVDVWAASFKAEEAFEADALAEIKSFWKNYANDKGFLSRAAFMGWKDIQEFIAEGVVTQDDLNRIWEESLSKMKQKKTSANKDMIDYDTFLRLNVRIDLMIEDSDDDDGGSAAADDNSEEPAEVYYAKIFQEISGGKKVLALSDLFKWSELQDLIDESFLSTKAVIQLYEQMPQTVDEQNNKGISVASFIALNTMLDVMIDKSSPASSTGATASSGSAAKKSVSSAIPTALVAEGARPMPADRELKIGSLNELVSDENEGEMTAEELELMTALDKAENLLNTGSFQVSYRLSLSRRS
jgi:hypothetical protein